MRTYQCKFCKPVVAGLVAICVYFLPAQAGRADEQKPPQPPPPYDVQSFYNSIITLWNDGEMTDSQVLDFAGKRGINFGLREIARSKGWFAANDAVKDMKELAFVAVSIPAKGVVTGNNHLSTQDLYDVVAEFGDKGEVKLEFDQLKTYMNLWGLNFTIDDVGPFKAGLNGGGIDKSVISERIKQMVALLDANQSASPTVADSVKPGKTLAPSIDVADQAAKAQLVQVLSNMSNDAKDKSEKAAANAADPAAQANAKEAIGARDEVAKAFENMDQTNSAGPKNNPALTTNTNVPTLPFMVSAGAVFQNLRGVSVTRIASDFDE